MGRGVVILDVRPKEAFARSHLPHAINIGLSPSFSAWVCLLFASENAFTLVYEAGQKVEQITALPFFKDKQVTLLDFADAQGKMLALATLSVEALASSQDYLIVDVRTDSEWEEGHIAQAWHIPLTQFWEKFSQIPKDKDIALICGSGYRSCIFASLLQKQGYVKIANVIGGMHAWEEAGLEVLPSLPTHNKIIS